MWCYVYCRADAERILVQANTAEFCKEHGHEFLGKEAHIAAILTELYNRYHLKIRPEEVILFDDDQTNTDTALKFGHKAFLVADGVSEKTFEEYARDLMSAKNRRSWIK